jgi:hypothetical protein
VRSGVLVADVNSDIRSDPRAGPGTGIDLESDLGLTHGATVFFVEGTWRITRRHQLHGGYLATSREISGVVVGRPLTFGNATYNVNARVDAENTASYLSADYGFAFVATPVAELGATIGVTALAMHTRIGVSPQFLGRTLPVTFTDEAGFTEPMALGGVFANVRVHPRVTLRGSVRYVRGAIRNADGHLYESRVAADIGVTRQLGVGVSYYRTQAALDGSTDVFTGHIGYEFSGPQFYGVVAF